MDNYQTLTPKELFVELVKIENEIKKVLNTIDETYKETHKNLSKDFTIAGDLEHEYESGSIGKTIKSGADIVKLINNVLHDQIIREAYLKQIQSIGQVDLKRGLENTMFDWQNIVKKYEYTIIFRQAIRATHWITECGKISEYLLNFNGTINPFVDELDSEQPKIELLYLGRRGICLNTDKRSSYIPKIDSDRYKYLKVIIENKGEHVTATQLSESIGKEFTYPNSGIVISAAIFEINKLIKENLGLTEDLIFGENGYRLNTQKYQIIQG